MPAGPQLYAGTGTGGGSYDGGPWVCCDSEDIFDITGKAKGTKKEPVKKMLFEKEKFVYSYKNRI